MLLYETMISQQKDEEVSTIQYILQLLDRRNSLGQEEREYDQSEYNTRYTAVSDACYNDLWMRSFTYGHLKI
jgi:hypothetical protein